MAYGKYVEDNGYGQGNGGPNGGYGQDDISRRQAESDAQADADTEKFLASYEDQGRAAAERDQQIADRRKTYRDRNKLAGGDGVNGEYRNPGSADYGGNGGVDFYRNAGIEGGHRNDAAQAANSEALKNSLANMQDPRGQVAHENPFLASREAATRGQQMNALNLSRDAAMGKAPSEAAFQTTLGMNDIMGAQAGQVGTARGLAGLSGAQMQGGAMAGQSAGNLAMTGGLARSKEIGDAIGMYGSQAGAVGGQDVQRLGQNTQNGMFNAKLNDDWKLGNANLAQQQGRLGVSQGATDLAWMGEQTKGADKQFEYDQRMAASEAGADADKVAAKIAGNREDKENKRQLVNGGITAGLTVAGTVAGGPVGGALGGAAGQQVAGATKDWW